MEINTESEIEKLKEKVRYLTIRYDNYLNDYISRYHESIDNYDHLKSQLRCAKERANDIEEKYQELVSVIKQYRRIIGLYDSVYAMQRNETEQRFSNIALPQHPAILTNAIATALDKIIDNHPVFDYRLRKKELQQEKQEDEKHKEFYELINSKYTDYEKKRVFEFLKENIDGKTPNPIRILLLLSKKHELLSSLPKPLQIRNHFDISDSRYKKLFHYEKDDVYDANKYKKQDVQQIEEKVKQFKKQYSLQLSVYK